MKKYICEMCSKKVSMVHDHHVIPWWFSQDDSESNIMRLCPSCHKKADASFNNLILRGEMNVGDKTLKRTQSRYTKKYKRNKRLFCFRLFKYTFYYDSMRYNIKTGEISISSSWIYQPYKYKYVGNADIVKSRACLSKAASVKGQVALGV